MKRFIYPLILMIFVSFIILYFNRIIREPSQLSIARKAYESGDWRKAFNDSARQLRETPDNPAAQLLMARSAARIQRDQVALEIYDKLPETRSQAEDLFLVGSILFRQSRMQDGEKLIRRSLEINPNYYEPARFLTQFGFQNRRYEDAMENVGIWARHLPELAQARLLEARIAEAMNQPDLAVSALNAILSTKLIEKSGAGQGPDLKNISLMLVRNLLRMSKPEDASALLNKIEPDWKDAEISWLRSRCFLQMGKATEASRAIALSRNDDEGGFQPGNAEEPSPFAGAKSCRECHAEIYDDQQNSRHAMTFHLADEPGPIPWVKMLEADPATPKIQAKFDNTAKPLAFQFKSDRNELSSLVRYIMGSGRHAVTPILELKGQKSLYECRWTFYSSVQKWDLTPGQPAVPPSDIEFAGTGQTADMLRLCLNCHTTNPTAILQKQGPEAKDRAIGCEKCHGPGGNHISAMKLNLPEKAIGRFRRNVNGQRPQVMQMCGECHGTMGREIPQSFDAGTVRFQATTLTFSECYKKSGTDKAFDCLSCHSPHQDVDTAPDGYNSRCISCHDPGLKASKSVETMKLCRINTENDCVKCHMPKIQSVQRHTRFTDHFIRKPKSQKP